MEEKKSVPVEKQYRKDIETQDVILAQKGDGEAYTRIIEMCKQAMYKVARSYLKNDEDVADVLQESILKCYQSLRFLKKPQYFKTWLIRIVINECNDLLRRKKRETQMDEQEMLYVEQMEQGYNEIEFQDLMSRLPEKYRTILVLYYAEGYHTKEIAMMLGMRPTTVRTRLARARKYIKMHFTGM